VEQLVRVLTSDSYFDLALRLASMHSLPKTMILEYIAGKCVALTRDEALDDANSKWLSYNYTSGKFKKKHSRTNFDFNYFAQTWLVVTELQAVLPGSICRRA